jgi:hypothetical protein
MRMMDFAPFSRSSIGTGQCGRFPSDRVGRRTPVSRRAGHFRVSGQPVFATSVPWSVALTRNNCHVHSPTRSHSPGAR